MASNILGFILVRSFNIVLAKKLFRKVKISQKVSVNFRLFSVSSMIHESFWIPKQNLICTTFSPRFLHKRKGLGPQENPNQTVEKECNLLSSETWMQRKLLPNPRSKNKWWWETLTVVMVLLLLRVTAENKSIFPAGLESWVADAKATFPINISRGEGSWSRRTDALAFDVRK